MFPPVAVYPVAGADVADELEKLCFPDQGQCRGVEDFFARYEKAVDGYEVRSELELVK